MTASKPLLIQPKFAQQIRSLPSALGTTINLQRGYMIWENGGAGLNYTGGVFGDGRDIINFLYNPSTISSDYNIANASLQAAMLYTTPLDQGNLLAPLLMQTVSFQLYFDRTYELNYGGNSSAVNDPAVIGVQADILQFMQFTGLLQSLSAREAAQIQGVQGTTNVGSATYGTASAVTSGGIMMMIPCFLFFSNALAQMNQNASSTNFAATAFSSQLMYYGYISEWSPTYTHFTESMVPIRASIDVTFTMLPTPTPASEQAVWKDAQKQGRQPYTVQAPLSPTATSTSVNTSVYTNLPGSS